MGESTDEDSEKDNGTDRGENRSAVDTNGLREVIKQFKVRPRKSEKTRRVDVRKNKYLRNTGQAYVSKGKERPAREMKELNVCRFNCKGKIPEQAREELFTNIIGNWVHMIGGSNT